MAFNAPRSVSELVLDENKLAVDIQNPVASAPSIQKWLRISTLKPRKDEDFEDEDDDHKKIEVPHVIFTDAIVDKYHSAAVIAFCAEFKLSASSPMLYHRFEDTMREKLGDLWIGDWTKPHIKAFFCNAREAFKTAPRSSTHLPIGNSSTHRIPSQLLASSRAVIPPSSPPPLPFNSPPGMPTSPFKRSQTQPKIHKKAIDKKGSFRERSHRAPLARASTDFLKLEKLKRDRTFTRSKLFAKVGRQSTYSKGISVLYSREPWMALKAEQKQRLKLTRNNSGSLPRPYTSPSRINSVNFDELPPTLYEHKKDPNKSLITPTMKENEKKGKGRKASVKIKISESDEVGDKRQLEESKTNTKNPVMNMVNRHGSFLVGFALLLLCVQIVIVVISIYVGNTVLNESTHQECKGDGENLRLIGICHMIGPIGLALWFLYELFCRKEEESQKTNSENWRKSFRLMALSTPNQGIPMPKEHIPPKVEFKLGTRLIKASREKNQGRDAVNLFRWKSKDTRRFHLHVIRGGYYRQAVLLVEPTGTDTLQEVFEKHIGIPSTDGVHFFGSSFEEYRCQGDSTVFLRLYHLEPRKSLRRQLRAKGSHRLSREIYAIVDEKKNLERRTTMFGALFDLRKAAKKAIKESTEGISLMLSEKSKTDAKVETIGELKQKKRVEMIGEKKQKKGKFNLLSLLNWRKKTKEEEIKNAPTNSSPAVVIDRVQSETISKKNVKKHEDKSCEHNLDVKHSESNDSKKLRPSALQARKTIESTEEKATSSRLEAPVQNRRKFRTDSLHTEEESIDSSLQDRHVWYYRHVILSELNYHGLLSKTISPAVLYSEMFENTWLRPSHLPIIERAIENVRKEQPDAEVLGIHNRLNKLYYCCCWHAAIVLIVSPRPKEWREKEAKKLAVKKKKKKKKKTKNHEKRFKRHFDESKEREVVVRIPGTMWPCYFFTCLECCVKCGGGTCFGEYLIQAWVTRTTWYYWVISIAEVIFGIFYGIVIITTTLDVSENAGVTDNEVECRAASADAVLTIILTYWILHFACFILGCCLEDLDGFKLGFRLCCPAALPATFFRKRAFGIRDPKRENEVLEYMWDIDYAFAKKNYRARSTPKSEKRIYKELRKARRLNKSTKPTRQEIISHNIRIAV